MNLPDALFAEVRGRARAEGRTVTSVVEEALRDYIERATTTRSASVRLTTWDLGGPSLVDLQDKAALYEVLHGEEDELYRDRS